MQPTVTLVSLLAATLLWSGCCRTGDASTKGDVNEVNASPNAIASSSSAPRAATPDSASGGLTATTTPGPANAAAPTLPPCAQAGPPVNLPPEFPQSFPLPPGTVITVSRRAEPALVVQGFMPMELKDATRFFVQKLPAAGFQLGRGEAERNEAEARIGGNGVIGYFKLRSITDCPGALEFTIRVQSAIAQSESDH